MSIRSPIFLRFAAVISIAVALLPSPASVAGQEGSPLDRSVEEWTALLSDADGGVRATAALWLGELGSQAAASTPALIAALTDRDPQVRAAAASALGAIGATGGGEVPALIGSLADRDYSAREAVMAALAELGPAAVSALEAALGSGSVSIRRGAAEALGKLGPRAAGATPELLAALSDPAERVRATAAEALGWIGARRDEALTALIAALADPSATVRGNVAEALGRLGAAAAAPRLMGLLADGEPWARSRAADALRHLGAVAVPLLVAALDGEDRDLRRRAAEVLWKLSADQVGPALDAAVPALVVALAADDSQTRDHAADALGWIGPVAGEVVPALIRALDDDRPWVADSAVEALARIGPADDAGRPDPVLPVLRRRLESPDAEIRAKTLRAFATMLPAAPDLAPTVIRLLREDPASKVRKAAAAGLGEAAAVAERTVPALISTLEEDPDPGVRYAAVDALATFGAAAEGAVPALLKILASPAGPGGFRLTSPRAGAVGALARIAPASEAVLAALVAAMEDPDYLVRNSAVMSIDGCPAPEVLVPGLIGALDDPEYHVREPAAEALGRCGAVTDRVVPALIGALGDEESMVRRTAAQSLRKIGPAARAAVPALERRLTDPAARPEVAAALQAIGPLSAEEHAAIERQAAERRNATLAAAAWPALVSQTGPTRRIQTVAVSADGSRALTDGSRRLILWDVASGRELRRLDAEVIFAEVVELSADGTRLLIGREESLTVWDLATGEVSRQLEFDAAVTAAVFSPEVGEVLVAAGTSAILVRLSDGRTLQRIEADTTIRALAMSPDGTDVAAGLDTAAGVWDRETGRQEARWPAASPVAAVAFSHGGGRVLIAEGSKLVVRDPAGREPALELAEGADVRRLRVSPDGRQALALSDQIRLWDLANRKVLHRGRGRAMAFSADGPLVFAVVGQKMQTVAVRQLATGQETVRLTGLVEFLTSAAFSGDGGTILVGGWGGATIWDLEQGRVVQRFDHPPRPVAVPGGGGGYRWRQGEITSVALSPDGSRALTGGSEGYAILWDTASGRAIRDFQGQGVVESVALSPDGRRAVIGRIREATLRDLESGDVLHRWTGLTSQVGDAVFSADGRRVLTGSGESILWDAETGAEVQRLQGGAPTFTAALAPDGGTALTATYTHAIHWDTTTGQVLRRLFGRTLASAMSEADLRQNRGHRAAIVSVAYSPDGDTALTGSFDGTALLWDLSTGEVRRRFEGHQAEIIAAVFSPDGERVFTAALDGKCILWQVESGEPVATLVPFDGRSWAVVDPQGRFDTASLEESSGFAWVFPDDPFRPLPLEIFLRDYYEPRLLPRLLKGEELPELRPLGSLNRVQPVIEEVTIEPRGGDRVQVTVRVAGGSGEFQRGGEAVRMSTGVYDLRLFRDGQLVAQWPDPTPGAVAGGIEEWRRVNRLAGAGESAVKTATVRLPRNRPAGSVRFSAYAFNEDRVKSAPSEVDHRLPEEAAVVAPRAFVVTVGVSAYESRGWNLGFAASDARRVQAVLGDSLEGYEVVPVPLLSELAPGTGTPAVNTATRANIRAVLEALAGRGAGPVPGAQPGAALAAATPDDLVLLFFAGHGFTDAAGTFYFLPHDIGKDRPPGDLTPDLLRRTVSSTDLAYWLRGVDAAALVLIIDACHSAGAVEPPGFKLGPFGSRGLGQLAYDKGMRVLAASQSDEAALESASIEQGLLTYALVEEGLLAGKAAERGAITLGSWLAFGARRVPGLFRDVVDGTLRGVVAVGAESERWPPVQSPAYFDFTRATTRVVLAPPD